jgi:hypothetical protein
LSSRKFFRECSRGVYALVPDLIVFRPRSIDNFAHQLAYQPQAFRVIKQCANPSPGQRRDGIERPVPHQLVPPKQHDVVVQLAHYSRPAEDFCDPLGAIGFAAVELAKVDMTAAQMDQLAGLDYFDSDPRVAAQYSFGPKISLRRASFSTPFCRVRIAPPSARHPRIAAAAWSVS